VRAVCVFCGSSSGGREDYREAAAAVGTIIARRGLRLVYGGGRVGLMGVVADAALAAGGEVVGVIPRALHEKEIAHLGLTELRIVGSMHARKAMMAEFADGFLALPGGYGTLEELFETLTWAQLGLHRKPCGLLDVAGYYAGLHTFFDHALAEAFVRPEHRRLVLTDDDPERLLDRMAAYEPPDLVPRVGPGET